MFLIIILSVCSAVGVISSGDNVTSSRDSVTSSRVIPGGDGEESPASAAGSGGCTCAGNHYRCTDDVCTCIARDWVCDGDVDCNDGSDESTCPGKSFSLFTHMYLVTRLEHISTKCSTGCKSTTRFISETPERISLKVRICIYVVVMTTIQIYVVLWQRIGLSVHVTCHNIMFWFLI